MACPLCASTDVYYTCTPNCCFNHVCGNCGATFEPITTASGQIQAEVVAPDPLPEATDPTVACARCDAVTVYSSAAGGLVCSRCGAILVLEFTETAPA